MPAGDCGCDSEMSSSCTTHRVRACLQIVPIRSAKRLSPILHQAHPIYHAPSPHQQHPAPVPLPPRPVPRLRRPQFPHENLENQTPKRSAPPGEGQRPSGGFLPPPPPAALSRAARPFCDPWPACCWRRSPSRSSRRRRRGPSATRSGALGSPPRSSRTSRPPLRSAPSALTAG